MTYPSHRYPQPKKPKRAGWIAAAVTLAVGLVMCACALALATSGDEKKPDAPAATTPAGLPPSVVESATAPVETPGGLAPEPTKLADVYYASCAAARAAGAAPLHRGEPGYRSGLDRDGDGTACDK